MPTAAPIVTSLEVVEDALLSAVRAAVPDPVPYGAADAVAWGLLPADTVRRLFLDPMDAADALRYGVVLQHQDGGGAPASHVNSAGWQGLVVLRCLATTDAAAREGYGVAAAAMATAAPTGYRVGVVFDRPIAVPTLDGVVTRAGQWRVTLRRTA